MKLALKGGATDVTLYVFVQDTSQTDGSGLTGLVWNTSGLTCYYVRERGTPTALTLATLASATAAHADGGFIAADGTNMPGVYRLDLSDTIIASGSDSAVLMLKGATNMAPVLVEIQLTGVDLQAAQIDTNVTQISGTAAAADNLEALYNVAIASGTTEGTQTTTSFDTDLAEATNDHYNNMVVVFTSGTLAGQARKITDYVGATGTITVNTALTDTPAAHTFLVLGYIA